MNDDELERRLRDWGEAQRSAAPPVAVPVESPASRRKLWAVLAAAAVALVVGGVVAAIRLSGPGDRAPAANQATGSGSASAVPGGTRRVVFHGLAVTVPAGWPLNATRCGVPIADTVVLPGFVPACGSTRTPSVTSVEFGDVPPPLDTRSWQDVRSESVHVAGVPAGRTSGRVGALYAVVVTVPSLSASVLIESPRLQTVDELAAGVTVVTVDDNGCAARSGATDVLPTGREPSRPGAGAQLVPDTPVSVRICRYDRGFLEQSTRLDGSKAQPFVALLDGLPGGLSRADPTTYLPSLCHHDPMDAEGFLITARYASGPDVDVVVRLGLCGDLGASNGTATGQWTMALAEQLTRLAGSAVGFPGGVGPKK